MESQPKKHIYIHICSTNGTIAAETTILLLGMQQVCHELSILCTISISNSPKSYWTSRNKAVKEFKDNEQFTHLLFLTDKISTNPRVLNNLLQSEHNVSGLIAPLGVIRWPNLLQKKNLNAINTILQDSSSSESNLKDFWTHIHSNINMYNAIFKPDTKIGSDGWVEVDSIGTDILLINREVINKLPENTFKSVDDSILIDRSFNDELKKLEEPVYIWPEPMVVRNTTHQFIGRVKDVMATQFELKVQPKVEEITDLDCETKEYQPPVD